MHLKLTPSSNSIPKTMYKFSSKSAKILQVPIAHSPKFNSKPEMFPTCKSGKRTILKKIQTLKEIGFESQLNCRFDSANSIRDTSSRRFSIGISDFWSSKNRKKLLQQNGYGEAFEALRRSVVVQDLILGSARRKSVQMGFEVELKKRAHDVRRISRRMTEKVSRDLNAFGFANDDCVGGSDGKRSAKDGKSGKGEGILENEKKEEEKMSKTAQGKKTRRKF